MGSSYIDLIIGIKNGYLAKKELIETSFSNLKIEVLKKLQALKFVKGYKVSGDKIKKIQIELLYDNGVPAMTDVKIYSKPGRRWYVPSKSLKTSKGILSFMILSTSKGLKTNHEAQREKVGGELLFEAW